jgi:nucleoid-associated protein YgaU
MVSSKASAASASAKASTAAANAANQAGDIAKSHYTGLTIVAIVITVLAVAVAALYFSGQADDLFVTLAKKYYKAEAKAEAKAFEKAEGDQAKSFFKSEFLPNVSKRVDSCSRRQLADTGPTDQLKKNPVMGEGELDQVAPGLGAEAAQEGLGGVSDKLGGLGKL